MKHSLYASPNTKYFYFTYHTKCSSLLAQMVKNLPAMQKTWIWSLGWEDPLEEDMATHSSILAWRIPMNREAWQATVHGDHKELDMTEWLSAHITQTNPKKKYKNPKLKSLKQTRGNSEGQGSLECCGPWSAMIHGVA